MNFNNFFFLLSLLTIQQSIIGAAAPTLVQQKNDAQSKLLNLCSKITTLSPKKTLATPGQVRKPFGCPPNISIREFIMMASLYAENMCDNYSGLQTLFPAKHKGFQNIAQNYQRLLRLWSLDKIKKDRVPAQKDSLASIRALCKTVQEEHLRELNVTTQFFVALLRQTLLDSIIEESYSTDLLYKFERSRPENKYSDENSTAKEKKKHPLILELALDQWSDFYRRSALLEGLYRLNFVNCTDAKNALHFFGALTEEDIQRYRTAKISNDNLIQIFKTYQKETEIITKKLTSEFLRELPAKKKEWQQLLLRVKRSVKPSIDASLEAIAKFNTMQAMIRSTYRKPIPLVCEAVRTAMLEFASIADQFIAFHKQCLPSHLHIFTSEELYATPNQATNEKPLPK